MHLIECPPRPLLFRRRQATPAGPRQPGPPVGQAPSQLLLPADYGAGRRIVKWEGMRTEATRPRTHASFPLGGAAAHDPASGSRVAASTPPLVVYARWIRWGPPVRRDIVGAHEANGAALFLMNDQAQDIGAGVVSNWIEIELGAHDRAHVISAVMAWQATPHS
jgi:hypothetical protein